MEFRNNFQELKSQIEYLSSLNKEDVTHTVSYTHLPSPRDRPLSRMPSSA